MRKSRSFQIMPAVSLVNLRRIFGKALRIASNRISVEEVAIQNAFNTAVWRLNLPRNLISSLTNILEGKEILVLGSAPNPALPPNADSMEVICVNGSNAIAKEFNLKIPLVTIVDREILKLRETGEKRHREFQNLRSGEVGLLVSVSSNDCKLATEALQFLTHTNFQDLNRSQRVAVLRMASRSPIFDRSHGSLTSSGAFAVALISLARPEKLWVAGVRLNVPSAINEPDHHYELKSAHSVTEPRLTETVGRNHSRADAALISFLSMAGYPIDSIESEIQPLCSNWRTLGRHQFECNS